MTSEVNFDGLVGPTHNYAGLSLGNRASMGNAGDASSPRTAVLQGIDKMRQLHRLGVPQAVLPPHHRPDPRAMRQLGFGPSATIADVAAHVPQLVPLVMSASSMWTANAATVSPSADTNDGRVHLTPANLSSTAHRSFESPQSFAILGSIFADAAHFAVHEPLPLGAPFSDEGAANHGRLTPSHDQAATHIYVYGREASEPLATTGFPRRQTRLAGELISRSHGVAPDRTVFVRQSQVAIDAGAFHNDVVSVVNERVVFAHEHAFDRASEFYASLPGATIVEVTETQVPLADAISSYLFNSQLVTLPDGSMVLIAPADVMSTPSTAAYLADAIADPANPIAAVHALDLRESMRNGGGPACLRLRVVLTDAEIAAMSGRVIADDALLDELAQWATEHYRDELRPADLADPQLAIETMQALDRLTQILELPGLYDFQR